MRAAFAIATISGGAAAATVASTSVALAATVLTVTGSTLVGDWHMDKQLQGAPCQAPNICVPLEYPSSTLGQAPLDEGAAMLQAEINNMPGEKVVLAYSQGGIIATTWLQNHADDDDAPPADELTFILFGNPQRGEGGLAPALGTDSATPTDTEYKVIDVARQYDPEADWPNNPLNGLAVANAAAGYFFVHTNYYDVDVNSADNLVKQVGNTTYVLVPTENLPLLEPLRQFGMSSLADMLNGPLKTVVDAGYDRTGYAPATAPVLPTSGAQENSTVQNPTTSAPRQTVAVSAIQERPQNRSEILTSAADPTPADPTPADQSEGNKLSATWSGARPSRKAKVDGTVADAAANRSNPAVPPRVRNSAHARPDVLAGPSDRKRRTQSQAGTEPAASGKSAARAVARALRGGDQK